MNNHSTSRRKFLGNLGLLAGATTVHAVGIARPKPPYRVWFQPRLFHRDMSLYAGMTMEASGWLDPQLAALAGKTALRWLYGANLPDARGPEYWQEACGNAENRNGVALDEWVPVKNPEVEGWVADGLRRGRKAAP